MAIKWIELIGTSSKSREDSVESVINKAGESLKNIHAADVLSFKAKVENRKISEYPTNVKIAFIIE